MTEAAKTNYSNVLAYGATGGFALLALGANCARSNSLACRALAGSAAVSLVAAGFFFLNKSHPSKPQLQNSDPGKPQSEQKQTSWTSWNDAPIEDLQTAVREVRAEYEQRERDAPAEGYILKFLNGSDVRRPEWELTDCGSGKRTQGSELSGVQNDKKYADNCVFCQGSAGRDKPTPISTWDNCYSVKSKSSQLLIVPKEHYAHWFKTPEDIQVSLLQRGFEARRLKGETTGCVSLHCGTQGAQTIFHTHLRTGIVIT